MVESNPIKKEDPNAIPGQKASDKKKELIAERVKESNEEKPTSECELIVTPYLHLIKLQLVTRTVAVVVVVVTRR